MKIIGRWQLTLWAALSVAYLSIVVDGAGILCYYCTVGPKQGEKLTGGQICSRFKKSVDFQIWCPNSTLCMTRSIHYQLGNGTFIVTSVERGCAPQLNTFHEYNLAKKEWNLKQQVIEKAYDERCFTGEDRGGPGGPSNYCLCRFHLCNESCVTKNVSILTFITTSLLLWMQRNSH